MSTPFDLSLSWRPGHNVCAEWAGFPVSVLIVPLHKFWSLAGTLSMPLTGWLGCAYAMQTTIRQAGKALAFMSVPLPCTTSALALRPSFAGLLRRSSPICTGLLTSLAMLVEWANGCDPQGKRPLMADS